MYSLSLIKLFWFKFLRTKSLLNFASFGSLTGLYLLGAFGKAASKAASSYSKSFIDLSKYSRLAAATP